MQLSWQEEESQVHQTRVSKSQCVKIATCPSLRMTAGRAGGAEETSADAGGAMMIKRVGACAAGEQPGADRDNNTHMIPGRVRGASAMRDEVKANA